MSEKEDTLCENCGSNLTDPKEAGFTYDGYWFCSGQCAEAAANFWTNGETVEDYSASLKVGR